MTAHSQSESNGASRQVVTINAHTLFADLTPAPGETSSAPDPHDYFDVSLATCKALTAVWYARKNAIALERVEAYVDRDASKERAGTYGLHVKVAFFGPLSEEEKTKLFDVIERCPIHKLMTSTTVEISSEMLA